MTKREAKRDALKMWKWLKETGRNKIDFYETHPNYPVYRSRCALCEYIINNHRADCNHCPLKHCSNFIPGTEIKTPFAEWVDTHYWEDRKPLAAVIYDTIKAWEVK
jgi:hypothetical protein